MASKRWAIAGPGAPSPVGYLSAVDRWRAARDAWVIDVAKRARAGQPASPASALLNWLTQSAPPPPPDVQAILRANRAATRTAVQAARSGMVRAGATPAALSQVLAVPVGPGGLLETPDTPLGGIEVSTVSAWAEEGARLVRAISDAEVDDLSRRITEAASRGDRWETMAQALEESGRYQRARARLIARDQTSKLNGKLTRELQVQAGVERYWWRTSRNGRVRPSHRAVADQLWTWALGAPGVGTSGEHDHPGGPIQCRCTAEAELPEWMKGRRPSRRRAATRVGSRA